MVGRPVACRPAEHPIDWAAAIEAAIQRRLNSYAVPVLVRAGVASAPRWANDSAVRNVHVAFNMFASISRALELARTAAPEWVLLVRWDVFFYSAFDLAALDSRRFYLAGSCDNGPWATTTQTMRCRHGINLVTDCLPDFWFAAAPAKMRQVFVEDRDHRGDAQPATCVRGQAHGLLERRLRHLAEATDLTIGRYKVHMVDYTCVIRAIKKTIA